MDNHLFFVLKIEPKRLLRLRSCLKGFPISEKKTKTVQIEVSECKVKGANTIDKNKSQVKHYKLYEPQHDRVFVYMKDRQSKKKQQKAEGNVDLNVSIPNQFEKIECGNLKFFELLEKYNFFGQKKIKQQCSLVFQSIEWGGYCISVTQQTLSDEKILVIIQEKNVSTVFKSRNLRNSIQQRIKATFECILHFLFQPLNPKISDGVYSLIKRHSQKIWKIIRQFPEIYKKFEDPTARQDQKQMYDIKFWLIARILICWEAF